MSLVLYAVMDARPRPPQPRLRFVECARGLVAAVGPARRPPSATVTALRRHDAVVRRLARSVPALVPARFGSLAEDEDALRRELGPRRRELREALALVRGRVQMTLRVWDLAPPKAAPPAPPASGPGQGRRYLQARAAYWRGADVPGLAALLDGLRPLTAAERLERHTTPPLVASVHHLVDRGHLAAYRRALSPSTGRLRVRLSGPWPPYAFAAALPA